MGALIRLRGRVPRVGIALGPDRMVAVRGGAGHETRAWRLDGAETPGSWAALGDALAEARRWSGGEVLDVALLPPLVQLRRIDLPRMREGERRHVLTRDAARYFPRVREPQVVDALPVGRAGGGRTSLIAAAAPARLVEVLAETAAEAGWRLGAVGPAEEAWAAAARLWPPPLRKRGAMAVLHADRIDVVHLDEGRIDGVRRFPAEPEAIEVEPGAAVAIVAPPEAADLVRAALRAAGAMLLEPRRAPELAASPEALAAAFAGAAELDLRPTPQVRAQARRYRRTAAGLAALAAVSLVLAAGLELWGAQRELGVLERQRAELRPSVSRAVADRETLEEARLRAAAMDALEAGSPAWPVVVATLAEHLPTDAHLTELRAEGDSLVLEGQARSTGSVLAALRRTPGLGAVRLAAPVRRDLAGGGAPAERFIVVARLAGEPDATEPGSP